jgi:hypothetical protein
VLAIIWRCGYAICGHEFRAQPMTAAEHKLTPWRWCPNCRAASEAVGVESFELRMRRRGGEPVGARPWPGQDGGLPSS